MKKFKEYVIQGVGIALGFIVTGIIISVVIVGMRDKTRNGTALIRKVGIETPSVTANGANAAEKISFTIEEEPDYITYRVQNGDTLRKISQDHYKTELRAKDIIKLNGLENGEDIYSGQILKLPVE